MVISTHKNLISAGNRALSHLNSIIEENIEDPRTEKQHSCHNVTNFVRISMMFLEIVAKQSQPICQMCLLIFFNTYSFSAIIALLACSFHKGKVTYFSNILRVVRFNKKYMVDSARTDQSFNSFSSVYECCFQLKKSLL